MLDNGVDLSACANVVRGLAIDAVEEAGHGRLGASIADDLVKKGALIALDTDYELTPKGEALFETWGINPLI